MKDRFGLGWRPELAVNIISHLDRIDIVEVIADNFFARRQRNALRTLAAQAPVTLHSVSLGLASCAPVEEKRLEKIARLIDYVGPISWSEHLAFVRGGGIEIGHLAAPPRNLQTIDGAVANISRARKIVGIAPLMENVATIINPPGSSLDEVTWVSDILGDSGSDLLLDLHNLYANALNFGLDPIDYISRLPLERVRSIHLSGGKWVATGATRRLLDDHLHDVPDPVYHLLSEIGARTCQPLDIIIERDGDYPDFSDLLSQLDSARHSLKRGRERAAAAVQYTATVW